MVEPAAIGVAYRDRAHSICPNPRGSGDTARVNAPFAELVARLARHDLIEPYRPNDDRRAYDLEWCAFFLQEMVMARGIEVLLHSRVVAAQAREGEVRELTVSTAGGLVTVTPRFVIDASGACIVPYLTGFPVDHEGANRQGDDRAV